MIYCHIKRLPTLSELRAWAKQHRTEVRYLGPTMNAEPVYGAQDGPIARIAILEKQRDPHPLPVVWKSPLEDFPRPRGPQ